jgi:hypothetical protein
MNATEERVKAFGFDHHMTGNEWVLKMIFGTSESLCSYDTYQFEDYSKVVSDMFDVEKKTKRRNEVFPKDCEKAYELGVRFAK